MSRALNIGVKQVIKHFSGLYDYWLGEYVFISVICMNLKGEILE